MEGAPACGAGVASIVMWRARLLSGAGESRIMLRDTLTEYRLEKHVVLEMAHIEVLPGKNEEFEAGVKEALPLFARAKGCAGAQLQRIVEHRERYVLVVQWETIEDHMVHFRQSEDFQTWRGLVGSCFAKPPEVVHTEVAVK